MLAFKTRLLLAPRAAITLIRLLGREVAPAIGAAAVVQLGLAHISSLTGSQKPTVATALRKSGFEPREDGASGTRTRDLLGAISRPQAELRCSEFARVL